MPTGNTVAALALTVLVLGCDGAPDDLRTDSSSGTCSDLTAFVASYGAEGPAPNDALVTMTERHGELLMYPALWDGAMVLQHVAADSFVVAAHPRFAVAFVRGPDGCAASARVYGLEYEGVYERLDAASPRPVQLLLGGQPREAARRYAAADAPDPDRLAAAGRRFLRVRPSRAAEAVAFLDELARHFPDAAPVHAALGDALVAAGDRAQAELTYEHALTLDPANEAAVTALRRLGTLPAPDTTSGWQLPFSLEGLFDPPRQAEIDSAWARWERRELAPREVRILLRHPVDLEGVSAEARIVGHTVHGQRHLGVVIVPEGASTGELPVLVEAKGVSASFFPLTVPDGLTSPRLLGASRDRVVYVAPGYRGENIVIGTDTLTSEGDRSDAWDGATDDAIAFLRAALEATPEADTSRVCVFGRSRGGTVALLTGIREPRVDCVVSWAAPTDWLSGMDIGGWTQRELVEDGLRNRAAPGETGGQFINYFLSSAIAGRRGFTETRLHLIASSPRFFAERLPLAQVHWGLEDAIVPPVNGRSLVTRHARAIGTKQCLDARFHPNAGHDQDRQMAPRLSREFLMGVLLDTASAAVASCRP